MTSNDGSASLHPWLTFHVGMRDTLVLSLGHPHPLSIQTSIRLKLSIEPTTVLLPHAPLPHPEGGLLVERIAELGEGDADVALVVRLVGDDVPEEGHRMRLEPFEAAGRQAVLQ